MFKIFFAAAIAALLPQAVNAEVLSGPAIAIDGDSLKIGDRSIRLFGIDAPEAGQKCRKDQQEWDCGVEATSQLVSLIDSQTVTCDISGLDDYGRSIAVCSVGYLELNRTMVEQGWATAFRKYSSAYLASETRAKAARSGLWSSEFELPEYYRTQKRTATSDKAASISAASGNQRELSPKRQAQHNGSCTIKGNRNRKGQWIYHLPGMPYYAATRAEEIFCSEAAARRAGYRRAIVR